MTLAGIDFEPIDQPEPVPTADIEIDFDIEWDKSGRIYQWGLRVREGQDDSTARYEPIFSFEELDDAGELALAEQAAARIVELREHAAREGKTLAVYHWHHVEVSKTRKFDCAVAALEGVTVDLLVWFTGNFRVRGSSGIKNVASIFEFAWSVDDPGGRASLEKIYVARGAGEGSEDARRWCLLYNESDVAAQAAIRDGLRRLQTP
jgi:predicted RecB family nuclease